jgi:hypothetical protein
MEPLTLKPSSQVLPSSCNDDAWTIVVWSATGRPAPAQNCNTPFRVDVAASARTAQLNTGMGPTSYRRRIIEAIERARPRPDMPTTGHG